jgi:hypothetical protein
MELQIHGRQLLGNGEHGEGFDMDFRLLVAVDVVGCVVLTGFSAYFFWLANRGTGTGKHRSNGKPRPFDGIIEKLEYVDLGALIVFIAAIQYFMRIVQHSTNNLGCFNVDKIPYAGTRPISCAFLNRIGPSC